MEKTILKEYDEAKEDKLKVILSIIEVQGEYRAVSSIEFIPEIVANKRVVYQDIKEAESTAVVRTIIREMEVKAKEWARGQKISFVHNLDMDSYP